MNLLIATVWTPDEMQSAQSALSSSLEGTNTSVTSCAGLDAATRAEWQNFYDTVNAFARQTPVLFAVPWGTNEAVATGTRADQLQGYQKELLAWQTKLSGLPSAKGCSFAPSLAIPSSGATGDQMTEIVKYGAIALAAVAGAFVVVKVLDEINLFSGKRAA